MFNLCKKATSLLLLLGLSVVSLQAQQRYNQRQVQKLQRLSKTFSLKYQKQRIAAHKKAKQLNIPIRIVSKNKVMELMAFSPNGVPLYYTNFNDIAAQTISTNRVRNDLNINGAGMTLGIWDGGRVRNTHREFTRADGTSRVTQRDNPGNNFNSHATHVAGTMVAAGVTANARGMAPGALLDAHDWTDDLVEMTNAAQNGLLVSNHSYGFIRGWAQLDVDDRPGDETVWFGDESISTTEDYLFGFYDNNAQDVDRLAFDAPNYLMCWAAGNDRNDAFNGRTHFVRRNGEWVSSTARRDADGNFDCIAGQALGKNVLTVGAVNGIAGGYQRANQVRQAAFSNWGPTDDGRIKPDIVANGVDLRSTGINNNAHYFTTSGTSMATPSVAGSLGLLQQYFGQQNRNAVMRSATLKALVIHTADEAGPANGPDYQNGWGLMNTRAAAQVITDRNVSSLIEEQNLQNSRAFTMDVQATGRTPLVATIVWTDLAGTPVAPALDPTNRMLVNDLDIRVTYRNPATGAVSTFRPWILNPARPADAATTGDNDRDNVEKIFIANPAAGTYTITVTHKGTLRNNNQAFSMIVTGVNENDGAPTCAVPGGLRVTNITNTSAVLSWAAVNGANSYDVRYRAQGTTRWTTASAVTVISGRISNLTSGTPYEFQVRTNCGTGSSDYSTLTNFATIGLPTGYCDVGGNTADEFINRIQFGTINNTSGDNDGYGNFTNQSTTLRRGSTTRLSITPQWTGRVFDEYYSIWIDLNRDGDFNDAGEQLAANGTPIDASPVSANITIPTTASLGLTRMRIMMSGQPITGPCGTIRFGEIEDYAINITNATNAANTTTASKASVVAQVAMEDLVDVVETSIYPNPAQEQINVQVNAKGEVTFILRNPVGAVLKTKSVKAEGGVARQVFDVSHCPAGNYFITIQQANGASQTKTVSIIK